MMLLFLSSQQLQHFFDCIIYSHPDHIPTGRKKQFPPGGKQFISKLRNDNTGNSSQIKVSHVNGALARMHNNSIHYTIMLY